MNNIACRVVGVCKAVYNLFSVYIGLLGKPAVSVVLICFNAAVRSGQLRYPAIAVILIACYLVIPIGNGLNSTCRIVRIANNFSPEVSQRNEISERVIAVVYNITSCVGVLRYTVD